MTRNSVALTWRLENGMMPLSVLSSYTTSFVNPHRVTQGGCTFHIHSKQALPTNQQPATFFSDSTPQQPQYILDGKENKPHHLPSPKTAVKTG
jgi:hypothetical protein